jgi:hypothetical protein
MRPKVSSVPSNVKLIDEKECKKLRITIVNKVFVAEGALGEPD